MPSFSNKYGLERRKINPKDQQKYLERKSAFRIDYRQRFDLFAKTVLVTTGGALTISMTIFLKEDALELEREQLTHLKWTWALLLYTLSSFATGMFLTVIQGFYVNWRWQNKVPLGDDQITGNTKMNVCRGVIIVLGTTGFVAFILGLLSLGLAATDIIDAWVSSSSRHFGQTVT